MSGSEVPRVEGTGTNVRVDEQNVQQVTNTLNAIDLADGTESEVSYAPSRKLTHEKFAKYIEAATKSMPKSDAKLTDIFKASVVKYYNNQMDDDYVVCEYTAYSKNLLQGFKILHSKTVADLFEKYLAKTYKKQNEGLFVAHYIQRVVRTDLKPT